MAVQKMASPGKKNNTYSKTCISPHYNAFRIQPPPQRKKGNSKNENLANLYQLYHSGDDSDFGT